MEAVTLIGLEDVVQLDAFDVIEGVVTIARLELAD